MRVACKLLVGNAEVVQVHRQQLEEREKKFVAQGFWKLTNFVGAGILGFDPFNTFNLFSLVL